MTQPRVVHKGWLLGVLLIAPFMAQVDATIANVATPSIHADLGASGAALELVIGGYLIAFTVLLITGARLGQTHGYRRTMLLLVLPLAVGRSEGWPVWAWVCLAASVPAFMLFLALERRITANDGSPLINVHVIARPAIFWGLLTLLAAIGTYYALLFTLAQYLQQGLGHSPLVSGLTLVPWVAAYGLAGQIVRRLPPRMIPAAPRAGCALLTVAYVAISTALFSGHHSEALLVPLLGVGGLGLGIQFSALIAHLTKAVPVEYAPDFSGVSTTAIQIGGAVGVAAFGTLYLSLTTHTGAAHATHAFALTTAAFAVIALLATGAAHRATRPPTSTETENPSLPTHPLLAAANR